LTYKLIGSWRPRCVVERKGANGCFSQNLPFVCMVRGAGSSDRITKDSDLENLTQPAEISTLDTVKAETALSNACTSLYAAPATSGLPEQNLRNDAAIHSSS